LEATPRRAKQQKRLQQQVVVGGTPGGFYDGEGKLKDLNESVADLWLPMTESQALDYYTPHEICSYAHTADGCKDVPGDLRECNAFGKGVKHACSNPAGMFLHHHLHKPHPYSQGVADVIIHMKKEQRNTMVVVGDSVGWEFVLDARCSILRAGFAIDTRFVHDGVRVLNHSANASPEQQKQAALFKKTHQENGCATVGARNFFQVLFVGFKKHNETHNSTMDSVEQVLLALANDACKVQGKLLIVINYGLHIHSKNDYTKLIREGVVPSLRRLAMQHNHTVIWRETSAQHFPQSNDGSYEMRENLAGTLVEKTTHSKKKQKVHISTIAERSGLFNDLVAAPVPGGVDTTANSFTNATTLLQDDHNVNVISYKSHPHLSYFCAPVTSLEAAESQNWRNAAMKSALAELDPQGAIKVAPFFSASLGRHDLHKIMHGDCVHYCHAPTLWWPVWQSIYDALQREKREKGVG